MEIANQVLYFSFSLIFFGLIFSAVQNPSHISSLIRSQKYWTLSLVAMAMSTILYTFNIQPPSMLISIRIVFQIMTDLFLVLLFRSFNKEIKNGVLVAIAVILVGLFCVLTFTSAYSDFEVRLSILSASGILISIWQIYELFISYKRNKSIYILLLLLAITFQIILWGYRIWAINNSVYLYGDSIYDEHVPEFMARLVIVCLYALIFITIGNYFYDQLVRHEKSRRKDKETQMLFALTKLASTKDNDTGSHMIRTQNFVRVLADRLRSMGLYKHLLDSKTIDAFYQAAPLHDIGKVGIPDSILLKKGPLNPEERKIMDTHVMIGESVLTSARDQSVNSDLVLDSAIEIAKGHHEKWDGSGYPVGLKGEAISLEARIMSVADMYDALTTERPYKKAWSHEEAVLEITKKKGSSFDPAVVEAFLAEQDTFKSIAQKYND